MPKEKIKPCPFCGSEKVRCHREYSRIKETWDVFAGAWVKCCKCEAFGPLALPKQSHPALEAAEEKTEKRAIKKWNTRAEGIHNDYGA